MTLTFSRDKNGNRIVRIRTLNGSFSVQTSVNLPRTHAAGFHPPIPPVVFRHVIMPEIRAHIERFGTPRQRALLEAEED